MTKNNKERYVRYNNTLLIPEMAVSGSNSAGMMYFLQKCLDTTLNNIKIESENVPEYLRING